MCENILKAEGMLCGLILKNPDTLLDYTINHKLLSEDALFYIGIVNKLLEKGINASVIGIITSDKNRLLINGDETRFLEPQRGDEIYKLF